MAAETPPTPESRSAGVEDGIRVSVTSDADIVAARQKARALAVELGFSLTDSALIATAVSELARNIVRYARGGEIIVRTIQARDRRGIGVISRDEGPGILNVEQAIQDGYSTSGGLGLGLPGVRRLMDEFEISSEVGKGTTVSVKKWRPPLTDRRSSPG